MEALSRQGHVINVLSRRANSGLPPGVQLVKGDLTATECPLGRLLDGCEVLFHCAGEHHDKAGMQGLHVGGTQRLLEAVLREAAPRGRVIHWVQLSSVGAYGHPQEYANTERVVTEETPPRPLGEYEVTKTQADELVMQAGARALLTYSIVRPSKVFGVGMSNQSLLSLGEMVRKGLFFYIGRPGAVATYVHVDDVVAVLLRCGTDHRAKGKIYNISNDCLLEEMVNGIASAVGVVRPRLRLPEPLVRAIAHVAAKVARFPLTQERINGLVRRTRYPYLKLERELGFTPRISVPGAIGEVIAK